MATASASLSDAMTEWVEAQAETDRYGSTSDYIRGLIRRDQERSDDLAQLQALIAEEFDGGISASSLDDVLTKARERMQAAQRR